MVARTCLIVNMYIVCLFILIFKFPALRNTSFVIRITGSNVQWSYIIYTFRLSIAKLGRY